MFHALHTYWNCFLHLIRAEPSNSGCFYISRVNNGMNRHIVLCSCVFACFIHSIHVEIVFRIQLVLSLRTTAVFTFLRVNNDTDRHRMLSSCATDCFVHCIHTEIVFRIQLVLSLKTMAVSTFLRVNNEIDRHWMLSGCGTNYFMHCIHNEFVFYIQLVLSYIPVFKFIRVNNELIVELYPAVLPTDLCTSYTLN